MRVSNFSATFIRNIFHSKNNWPRYDKKKLFVGLLVKYSLFWSNSNPLKPNDPYRGRTAPLTFKLCILYIYSTNIGTEYFFSSKCSLFHNSNVFGSCIIHIIYTGCAKIKKKILAPKG